jgi:hypothetical protein
VTPEPMQISESQLRSMTRELDDMHNETFPGVRKSLDEFTANLVSRRRMLFGAAGLVAVGALAACGDSDNTSSSTPAVAMSSASSAYTGDLKVVALAAALENLAVTAYDGALKKAAAGDLGKVPAAVATFVTTAR